MFNSIVIFIIVKNTKICVQFYVTAVIGDIAHLDQVHGNVSASGTYGNYAIPSTSMQRQYRAGITEDCFIVGTPWLKHI